MSVLLALQAPLLAADPATQQAIKEAEEGRRDTTRMLQPHPTHPMPYPWWGWPPYGYPPSSGAPYPGVPGAPYLQGTQQPASPYPMPVNPAGRVLLLVNPVDAEVYVDGVRLQQQADLSYEIGLLAGPHRVEVKKDGYKTYSQHLEIVPGSSLYLPIGLEK
jgi:hypothetical protein